MIALIAGLSFGTAARSVPRHHHRHCHRAHHRRHCPPARPRRPTAPSRPPTPATTTTTTPNGHLPSRLEVDENDQPYSLYPSHNPVAAGHVQFNVYNFGQDDHNFAIFDSSGHLLATATVPAGHPDGAVAVSAKLPAGSYRLECTLPGHAALGMRASLSVR